MLQESQRAVDIMRSAIIEQRSGSRAHVTLPATLIRLRDRAVKHTALVRDMSPFGIFFFCQIMPELGDVMNIELSLPDGKHQTRFICEGTVVRVEKSVAQAATGIALKFRKAIPTCPEAGPYFHV
jgi:hypothetical protein